MASILDRLDGLDAKFDEISTLITDPDVIADQKRYVRLTKEYHDLEQILKKAHAYRDTLANIEEAKKIVAEESDEELRAMAREQLDASQLLLPKLEEEIKMLMIPADPDDAKNCIVEIRGGTGGDEAALFAGDLFRMYQKFAERKGWTLAVSNTSEGAAGGYKEIVFSLTGEGVYGIMKYESGVHRVQRVPATETQGRIHTSAATVAVLPEAEEFDVEIHEGEIR
ncbi:MAG: PCRF domain-containing protein, partial [Muribaculaceae bacterium]|nr:PCRF domain-containing protein [Muribaculaceae bacterium]